MNRDVPLDLHDPALYLNRELAQLEFNFRVLAQAQDSRVPLLERMRYLCISCTNLDEFFEVRVAVLREQANLAEPQLGPDAMQPSEALARIRERALTLVALAELDIARHQPDSALTLLSDARAICEPLEARPTLERIARLELRLNGTDG